MCCARPRDSGCNQYLCTLFYVKTKDLAVQGFAVAPETISLELTLQAQVDTVLAEAWIVMLDHAGLDCIQYMAVTNESKRRNVVGKCHENEPAEPVKPETCCTLYM